MNKDDIHTFSTTYKTEIVNNTSQKSQKINKNAGELTNPGHL